MPRGKYTNHKGRNRRFTNPEELEEQRRREEKERKWRAERGEESSSEEEEEAAGDKKKESGSESSSESESDSGEESKGKGVEKLIEVENPNRVQKKVKKLSKLNEVVEQNVKPELSRKERKELEKQRATAHYQKLHAEGKTEQAQADLARLAIVKQQRADAAKRREEEKKDTNMAEEEKSFKFNSENNVYKKNVIIHDIMFKRILEPPVWLDGLESPFKWGLHIRGIELVRWNIPGKLCDYDNQGPFYGFERLAFLMAMLFMKTYKNKKYLKESGSEESEDENDSQVEEKVDEYKPEKCYAKCRETLVEMAANEGDVMYNRIGPGLQHVLQTTRAHMLFFSGNHAESQELARNIQPIEKMSQECMAGFEGLRAKVVMSMYQNYTITLPYLHKAMELDPNFGYWPYLTGKVLRRARREFDEGSIEEELKFFEKAVSLERNPKFLVFLGQAYQEKAVSLLFSKGPADSRDNLYQRAVELYSECWRLKNDSAAISRRVGNGMSKMRPEFIDKTVAKEALLKAIELSPNECTHLSLGKFYYIHEMDDEKALEHFEQCHPGNFGTSEIIRLNLIKDPNYDPYDILQSWMKVEKNTVKQYRAFCDAAWYYLVYRRDLESATKYIWKILVQDNKCIRAKRALEYRSYAFCVEGPLNLVEVLVNEILLLKGKNEILPPEDRKDMKLLEGCLRKLLEKYPDLRNLNPRPNLVEDLKQGVERFTGSRRRRRYGSVYRRSEPIRVLEEEPVSWRSSRPNDGTQEGNEQQPYRQQQGDGNRRYNQRQSSTDSRSDMRNSFGGRDDESRNRGYNRDDRRRNSESQSNWSNARSSDAREGTSDQNEGSDRFRGRSDRQYNRGYNRDDRRRNSESQSNWSNARSSDAREGTSDQNEGREYNNRYDVTITDWRSENRRQ